MLLFVFKNYIYLKKKMFGDYCLFIFYFFIFEGKKKKNENIILGNYIYTFGYPDYDASLGPVGLINLIVDRWPSA